MFGKLFGYLSLIRSGKLENDEENVVLIVDRLLELHNRKGWIREVVSESILTLLAVISGDMIKLVIPKLRTLLGNGDVPLCDMTAWQLMLCVGLQQLSATKGTGAESVKEELIELLPQLDMVTPGSLQEMIPTLLEATAGFPKVQYRRLSALYQSNSTSINLLLCPAISPATSASSTVFLMNLTAVMMSSSSCSCTVCGTSSLAQYTRWTPPEPCLREGTAVSEANSACCFP